MDKREIVTEEIKIWGVVQGVGFRPFLSNLANEMNIKGYVLNKGGMVKVIITSERSAIDVFLNRVNIDKPESCEIVYIERDEIPYESFSEFTIETSEHIDESNDDSGDYATMVPADMSVCKKCENEYHHESNPRYRHDYISCSVCGPRYSIIEKLPYDRENTTMDDFPMCEFCRDEYTMPSNRRYHAQTISCHQCGPTTEYITNEYVTNSTSSDDSVSKAIEDIKAGRVIALKGIGGYYFVADPFNKSAVKNLRELKFREQKPFAIMFSSIDEIKKHCFVSREEAMYLNSKKRPILLLEKLEDPEVKFCSNVTENSRYIGGFLPGLGLQYKLVESIGPLIMTSANFSDMPIITRDEEILDLLKRNEYLSGVLLNRREIKVGLDDSVASVVDGVLRVNRRSKGFAPLPLYIEHPQLTGADMILATGGHTKSTFALSKGNFSYLSQHLGDMDTMESRNVFRNNLYRMRNLFNIKPRLVACDLHPRYYTTEFAEEYVREENIETGGEIRILKVQHHHAHIASVMAEHGLNGPVIGVSFDGTGYGLDGNIWGGEFLICEKNDFTRYAHLKYTEIIGGDGSMKDGWKSALAHSFAHGNRPLGPAERTLDIGYILDYSIEENTMPETRETEEVMAALLNSVNTINTSSMGRLFDGVAALLGIHYENRYEGECAIMLENAAYNAMKEPGKNRAWDLALKFHYDVASFILEICKEIRHDIGMNTVALSGGVFQNRILMDKALTSLRDDGFNPFYNINIPTNDGGISFGQNFIGMHELAEGKII